MVDATHIRQTPDVVVDITKSRIEEIDRTVNALPPQMHNTSISHRYTSWSTPTNSGMSEKAVDRRPANDDVYLRKTSYGGIDGKGGPWFSSLTKFKRTDTSPYQRNWDDQHPPMSGMERMFRRWVSGRSVVSAGEGEGAMAVAGEGRRGV